MPDMTIGKLAKQTDVTVETIRYYERRGLLPKPRRTPAGYRLYPPEAVPRLRFIKRARDLEFTLDEVTQLLSLRGDPGAGCDTVERMARERLTRLTARIRELQEARERLERLVQRCEGGDRCAVLQALDAGIPEHR